MIYSDDQCWAGDFPGGSDGKESACEVGDLVLIPGLGRSPGPGQGVSPLSVSLGFSSSHPGPVDVGCALCAVTSWSERTCGFEG